MTEAIDGPRFETDIKPLFREKDQRSMQFRFDLSAYGEVKDHAGKILERLANSSMPCDGAWPPERVALFRTWVEAGCPE